jgi:6-phosphogluconolactonase
MISIHGQRGKDTQIHMKKLLIILGLAFLAGCGGGAGPANNQPPPPPADTPTITTISPNSIAAGGLAFTLTINGTNFVAGSMVNFGDSAPTTTFVNSTELTAAIPASGVAATGKLAVTVTNPAPDGGTSNAMNFTVTAAGPSPIPTISVLAPSCVPAGEQFIDAVDNQLTVISSDTSGIFNAGSVVQWNGINQPTTGNGSVNALVAQIPASDIAAAGTATVTVFTPPPGGGTSNSLTFTINAGAVDPQSIAVDPAGKFVYVANLGCATGAVGYVSMYTVNLASGALTSIGPPVPTYGYGAYGDTVAVDPSGKFAYATNSGDAFDYGNNADGSVAMYTINSTTGALTSAGVIPGDCATLCLPSNVVVDPSGKFAYILNGGFGSTGVVMYTINATTGALTSIGTIAAGDGPNSVAVDPSGKFVYVANAGESSDSAGNVSMYTINTATGALAATGTIAAGMDPTSVVFDPAANFAYVANFGSNDISIYTINTTTGILTSAGTMTAGTNPLSVAVDPTGKFAYVLNFGSNDVSTYTINAATGALTSTGTTAAGTAPTSIAIHPSGKFAYVTNSGSNNVSMYSIDANTGALTLLGTIGT